LLSLETVFEMPKQETRNKKQETRNKKQETRNKKQETRKSQRELRPAKRWTVDVAQFARNCHCKTLLSLLLYVVLHCPHVRLTCFHLSLHAEQRSR
jgi:hypothetical protein